MGILRTWSSLSSKNLNDGSNFTPTGVLSSSDDLLFTNTSVIDASATANLTVNSIRADSSYTGGLSFNNYTVALNGDRSGYSMYLSGAGNRYLGGPLIINGSSSIAYIGTSTKTLDTTNCDMTFNNWYQQLQVYKNIAIKNLTLTMGNDLVISGDGTTTVSHSTATPYINIGLYSTFTLNSTLVINAGIVANYSAFNFGSGYVFNGTGPVRFQGGTGNLDISVNYTGSGDWTNVMVPGAACFFQDSSFSSSFNSSNLNSTIRSNSAIAFTGNKKYFSLNAIDGTNCYLNWVGQDGTFTTPAAQLSSLTLGSNSQLRLNTEGGFLNFISSGTPLTMNNDSTLIINRFVYFRTTSAALHNIGLRCNILNPAGALYFSAVGIGTATFPAFNFPLTVNVTGSYSLGGSYGVRWTGNTNCTTLNVFAENACSRDATFDFNDYNIQCTNFYAGTYDTNYATPTRAAQFNYGDGTYTFGTYNILEAGRYVSHNLEGSLIRCSGNWTFPESPYSTIYPQNSYVKILGTSTVSMGFNQPGSFNNLEFDASSNIVTIIRGSLRAKNLWVKSGGWVNTSTILSGNLTCDTFSLCNLGSEWTFTGNNAIARFNSMGTQQGIPALNWYGNDGTWIDHKGLTMGGLTVSDGSSFNIVYGTAKTIFYTTPGSGIRPNSLKLGANSRLTVDASAQFSQYSLFTPGGTTVYDCTSPYTLNGTGPIELNLSSTFNPIICPGLTYSGSGLFTIIIQSGSAPSSYRFTGALSFGKNLTISTPGNNASSVNFYGPSITFPNNDSTFLAEETVGATLFSTYDAANCSIIFQGKRCALTDNYSAKTFKDLILRSDATVIKNGTFNTSFQDSTASLILEYGSRLKVDASTSFYLTSSGTPYSIAPTATLDGTSVLNFGLNNNDITGSITNFRYTGTGPINFIDGTIAKTGMLWNQESNLILGTNNCGIFTTKAGSRSTFNCNNYDMTCGSLKPGIDASSNFTINWGLGTRSINNYDGTTHNSATGTFNQIFNRSLFVCNRSWTYGSNSTITLIPGNFTLRVTGDSTLTSNGKYFNFVEINAPDSTVTLNDNLKCHGYKKTVGTLNANGKRFEITGDIVSNSNY